MGFGQITTLLCWVIETKQLYQSWELHTKLKTVLKFPGFVKAEKNYWLVKKQVQLIGIQGKSTNMCHTVQHQDVAAAW